MRRIKPTNNKHHWPRQEVKTVECRKKDLVVRITNWMRDRDEPGYDVECFIGGVYDWNESDSFTVYKHGSGRECKRLALAYAKKQIEKLL